MNIGTLFCRLLVFVLLCLGRFDFVPASVFLVFFFIFACRGGGGGVDCSCFGIIKQLMRSIRVQEL